MSWSDDYLIDNPVARSKRVPAPDEHDDIFDMENNLSLDLLSPKHSTFFDLTTDESGMAGFNYDPVDVVPSRGRYSTSRQSRDTFNGMSQRELLEWEQRQKEKFLRERGPTRCPERHAAGSIPELYWTEV